MTEQERKTMIKCNKCRKGIIVGNTNGLPNGIGFELESGEIINICQKCLLDLGRMTEQERDKFFDELMIKKRRS